MRVARRAGLHQDIALAAQARLDQTVMHGAGGEQRMHGDLALDQVAIGQEQHDLAAAHRGFRLIADLSTWRRRDRVLLVVLQIDELVGHAGIRQTPRSAAVCAAKAPANRARFARHAAAPARKYCTPGRSASAATSRCFRAGCRSEGSSPARTAGGNSRRESVLSSTAPAWACHRPSSRPLRSRPRPERG